MSEEAVAARDKAESLGDKVDALEDRMHALFEHIPFKARQRALKRRMEKQAQAEQQLMREAEAKLNAQRPVMVGNYGMPGLFGDKSYARHKTPKRIAACATLKEAVEAGLECGVDILSSAGDTKDEKARKAYKRSRRALHDSSRKKQQQQQQQ